MHTESTEILISGGGAAGLAAAAVFGAAGFDVICVDPAAPITDGAKDGADLRTTAFLQPSRILLEEAGLWQRLAPHAAALEVMRIIDAGTQHDAPLTTDFIASEISGHPFGWNVPNWLVRREFLARIQDLPNVSFRAGLGTRALMTRERGALVTLSDGARISARLVIAADGRDSPIRASLGIGVRTLHYGQKALAFAVTHERPHNNISTEVHRSGGPFTMVPLPDHLGEPCSAVVWMERGAEIKRLAALPQSAFDTSMTERSTGVLGRLTLASRRSVWPIISQIATRMEGERTALIAEAAHVVPPIGAQGLNMSLADLRCLLDLARENRNDPGTRKMLVSYHRRRWPEVAARIWGIDVLNRTSMVRHQPLPMMRTAALHAFHSLAPVRRLLMRAGLGTGSVRTDR